MIFRPELASKIKKGEKSQTRRPLKRYVEPDSPWVTTHTGGRRRRSPVPTVTVDGERYVACRYQVGHTYAVQPGRGKPEVTRIRVTDVRVERLGDISVDDARREGFKRKAFGDVDAFFTYWQELHGSLDRDQPVWVISFELEHDDTLFLAPARPGRPDYTRDPRRALDAGAVIDADTLDGYAAANHERFAAVRADETSARELRSSIERLKRLAKGHRGNSSAAQIIARHVDEIERELDEEAA